MRKKNNPEQEQPAAEEQETENPTEETEETQGETAQEQETEEQEETEDPGEDEENPQEEEEEEQEEQQEEQEEQPGASAQEQPDTDETAKLRSDLLQAQGKLAAYAAGVAPGMVDDAVTLAMAEAAKSGEVTEVAVAKAMDAVLKRHPEWKVDGDKKKTGGFKIGADRDNGGVQKKPGNGTQNVKRWNRFK